MGKLKGFFKGVLTRINYFLCLSGVSIVCILGGIFGTAIFGIIFVGISILIALCSLVGCCFALCFALLSLISPELVSELSR